MIPACSTPWCVALAEKDGAYCRIHRDRPNLRLVTGELAADGVDPQCSDCDGDGDCVQCDGDGTCECDCGNKHDCHQCKGSGKCPSCARTMQTRDRWAEEYLRFAFDAGWRPFDPDAEYGKLTSDGAAVMRSTRRTV
jgi:hypothetical protein